MTCKEKILAQLTNIPTSWAIQIANVICDTIEVDVTCEKVKECETLTTLSVFSVSGSEVCIEYKDEDGTTFRRCFNMNSIINNSLYNINPKCLTSQSNWRGMTFAQQWQMIIDKVCTDCTPVYTTTSTTTTTIAPTTTTTTTIIPTTTTTTTHGITSTTTTTTIVGCSSWTVTGGLLGSNWQYRDCDTNALTSVFVAASTSRTISCARDGYGVNRMSGDGSKTLLSIC